MPTFSVSMVGLLLRGAIVTEWLTPEDVDALRESYGVTGNRDWLDEMYANFCPLPVHVRQHFINCSLQRGHEGECITTLAEYRKHRCKQAGCGFRESRDVG